MRLWKKCFDTRGLCYTAAALETFLSLRVCPPGCSSPSPRKHVSPVAYLAAVAVLLGLVLSAGLTPARAEIISIVDKNGRRVFVNTDDQELRAAVERGGAVAALRLMDRRRRSLPGIEDHIAQVSRRHSVDPQLVKAVIEVESAWNPRARSRKGALGLMQLLPETAARFGAFDLFDPRENVCGGVRYLRFLLDRFDDDLELALAAYNAGENAVAAANGIPPFRETREYLERVGTLYGRLGRGHVRGTDRIYRVADGRGGYTYTNE